MGFILITDGRYFGKPLVFWVYDRLGPRIFGAAHEADRWYGLIGELGLAGDESVLDVGTAMGDLPLTLAAWPDFHGRIEALDWSPRMVAAAQGVARRRGLADHVCFRVHDARQSLPFPDATFDLVFCLGLLEAWGHPERILAELERVRAPGGRLVLSLYRGTPLQPATLDLDWYRSVLGPLGLTQLTVAPLRAHHDVVIAGDNP
jgi:ubiquinone/menaquinone biosynthesis C-methylase UbiE